MATKKITDFPLVGSLLSTDTLLVVRNGVTYRAFANVTGGGSGTTTPDTTVAFPRSAQFTDTSVYGRGSSATPGTLSDSGTGITFRDNTADADQGFKTVLRAIPTAPSLAAPFEFIANLSVVEGTAQYGLDGLAIADAAGNVQLWGVNGGNSGRSGAGCASYYFGGSWRDGDYTLGSSTDGSWFRIVVDDSTMRLYRSTDGTSWIQKVAYNLADHGLGPITRYGFLTHHYSGGTTDTLIVPTAYSTEFPAPVITVPKANYWRVFCPPGSGFYEYCFSAIIFLKSDGTSVDQTGASAFGRFGADPSPSRAFDGDPTTYAGDQNGAVNGGIMTGSAYFGLQFPSAIPVYGVTVTARTDNGDAVGRKVPEHMLLQYSVDGLAYKTALEFGGPPFALAEARTFMI